MSSVATGRNFGYPWVMERKPPPASSLKDTRPKDARAERLRSALRENLKRRKVQARGRAAEEQEPTSDVERPDSRKDEREGGR